MLLRYHNRYAAQQSLHKYQERPDMRRIVEDTLATRRPDTESDQRSKITFFGMKWRSICELERDK